MNVTTRPLCLSPRREAVLLALYRLARPYPWGLGHPPSTREILSEIMHNTGVYCYSNSTVWLDLDALWKLGLVKRPPVAPPGQGVARAWRPNYDRLLFVTVEGVTIVRERLQAGRQ